jgi:hypothetical protein
VGILARSTGGALFGGRGGGGDFADEEGADERGYAIFANDGESSGVGDAKQRPQDRRGKGVAEDEGCSQVSFDGQRMSLELVQHEAHRLRVSYRVLDLAMDWTRGRGRRFCRRGRGGRW